MEPTEQLAAILPTLSTLVDNIDADRLYDPTPCRRFTVHDVLDHMIMLGGSYAHRYRGEEPPERQPPVEYGWVPKAEFRRTMDDLLDAVRSPGAMDRTLTTPLGPMPGATFARLVAFDGVVHGWDIATATGQLYDPDPVVVAEVDSFARTAITADLRDGEVFAAETAPPVGATAIERLAAFSGRAVAAWVTRPPGAPATR